MGAAFDNVQVLGLLVQAVGALLIGLLCLMLNQVQRGPALSAWVRSWLSLGGALVALLVEQAAPFTAALTLPMYLFGEYLFGFWMIQGSRHFAGRSPGASWRYWLIGPLALFSLGAPQFIGYEFRKIFLLQAFALAAIFAASLGILSKPRSQDPASPGLIAMRTALWLLCLCFVSYLPVFAANILWDRPLPLLLLKLSSALHLVLEFVLGFSGAVVVLEQSHQRLLGRHDKLAADFAKLSGHAERDALTNAYNRRALLERLTKILNAATPSATRVTLMYLDLDNFKNVNDTHGHAIGDQLLIAVARTLQQITRSDDLVVRMGGDEFIVIAGSAQDREAAALLAQRIITAISEPLVLSSAEIRIQASIGIATCPDDGTTADVLMQHADVALYQAKSGGRNCYKFFDAQMNQLTRERVVLTRDLAAAIGTEQLFLEYQPLVDLTSGSIIALEALLRWQHPHRGLISPAEFIPLAEQTQLIDAIGEMVLRKACWQLQAWQFAHIPVVPIAVNVSAQQFEQGRIADLLIRGIEDFAIDPGLLRIEITETALMRNVQDHANTLRRLRKAGIKISIDDFGTGYSSLSYLKNLPVDCLKIDRSFIGQMIEDPRDAAVVEAVIGIARSMGICVVAEGVERADQIDRLRSLGCNMAQGYFFHRPMPAAQCRPLLEQLPASGQETERSRSRLLRWAT